MKPTRKWLSIVAYESGEAMEPIGALFASAELIVRSRRFIRGLDRKLGYRGGERFVAFYYEPRGEEVMWCDSRSYGFAAGGWLVFLNDLFPLARLRQVDLGDGEVPGRHALLIDRMKEMAYFVEKTEARRFLAATAEEGTIHDVPNADRLPSLAAVSA